MVTDMECGLSIVVAFIRSLAYCGLCGIAQVGMHRKVCFLYVCAHTILEKNEGEI